MNTKYLKVRSLTLSLGNFSLKNIDLACKKGEYHVLLGPTGSGKTSLMKCLLGFHRVSKGTIFLKDKDISHELPERRCMGYVPQNYALFPHLNVEENIRFGFHAKTTFPKNPDAIVDKLCSILNIQMLRKRNVRHLSGGERQKVALARALAIEPDIILLDEPFSSIDESAKRILWFELKNIIGEVGITAFHITHNLEEAYCLGERLSVLLNGELHQSDNRNDIFEHPATEGVARYLCYRNIFSGMVEAHPDGSIVNLGHFSINIQKKIRPGESVKLCVRPQDIIILEKGEPLKNSFEHNMFQGEIVTILPHPEFYLICGKFLGSPMQYDLELKIPKHHEQKYILEKGGKIQVALEGENVILLSR